ncbi:hypothetical protein [Shewanella salipaludis]|uniref:Uncharacterized protein n=1 Tax=Shewanella salipaludis TaxID=2723052 RepID=A0A972G3K5_9GAMM|nr:hypothetical protein [Shewanella salipaludis]NMH66856.1 hypothetical protein [Shewanella salipaludis]
MLCPHCSKSIGVAAITEQRGKGLGAQFQCPHCTAWLGRSPWLQRLKMLGFYTALACGIYAYWYQEARHAMIPAAIFALILLLVCHLMDHLHTVEAPIKDEAPDPGPKYR